MLIYIVFAIIVAVVFYDIIVFNSLIFLQQKVLEAKSGIDVQLKRRHDLISQLVKVVKQYTNYEQELFERIAQERTDAIKIDEQGKNSEVEKVENVLYSDVRQVLFLAESYPELKADKNFSYLQEEMIETEDQISAVCLIYNRNAQFFNSRTQSFPTNLVSKLHGFKFIDLFQVK